MLFAGLCVGVPIVIDQAARDLAADAKLAMKRADLTLDFVSRVTRVPLSRLSDQLNGKTPFTSLWRFYAFEEMRQTDWRVEFGELQADRIQRLLVSADFRELLSKVDALGAMLSRAEVLNQWLASIQDGLSPKAMAKVPDPSATYTHEVELPLRGRKEHAS